MKRVVLVPIFISALSAAAGAVDLGARQYGFVEIIRHSADVYNTQVSTANQIKINSIRKDRANNLCSHMGADGVFGWRGVIEQVGQVNDKAGVAIRIGPDILVAAEADGEGAIAQGSQLFDVLADMSEGDVVSISGNFLEGGLDCFRTIPTSDQGVFREPTFLFTFSYIEPVVGTSPGWTADDSRLAIFELMALLEYVREQDASSNTPSMAISSEAAVVGDALTEASPETFDPKRPTECRFFVNRVNSATQDPERLGTGVLQVREGRVEVIDGKWSAGPSETARDFSGFSLRVTEDGYLTGSLLMPFLFATIAQPTPPLEVVFVRPADAEGVQIYNGSVRFMIDANYDGTIALDACSNI